MNLPEKHRRLKVLLVQLHTALKNESDEALLAVQNTALMRQQELPVYHRLVKSIDTTTDQLLAYRLNKLNGSGKFLRDGKPVNPITWDKAYHVLNNLYEIDKAKTDYKENPYGSNWG